MIKQYEPLINEKWNTKVLDCLNEGCVGPGKYVEKFEKRISEDYNFKHVITTNSGTTAILLAIKAIQTILGDQKLTIIAPAYSFLAGHNAAAFLGHNIVLHDVYYNTGCMQEVGLDELIKKTKARIVLYINHNADNDLDSAEQIKEICSQNNCFMIEDSSQGIHVRYAGTNDYLGSVGDVGILSFSVPKLVTTGQGGAILTNNDMIADRCRRLRDHGGGRWRETRLHECIGGNFRMTDPQAIYGLAQLDEIDNLYQKRSQIHKWYKERFGDAYLSEEHSWMCIMDINKIRSAYFFRNRLLDAAAKEGVICKQYYLPINQNLPYLTDKKFKTATDVYNNWLYLPSSLNLTDENVGFICNLVDRIIRKL